MALIKLWKTAHEEIQNKHIQQVIGFADDGKLRDGRIAFQWVKIVCVLHLILAANAHAVDIDLARFATLKENQVRKNAETLTNKVPRIVWSFFDAVKVDDWETATNLAGRIMQASGRYTNSVDNESISPVLKTLIWPSISEMIGTYEQFHEWDNKWLHRFGSEIIDSIPAGSIYFGGTDPGRFLISALTEPREDGRRFFVLTQNQLADRTYLEYLQKRYGKELYIPTEADMQSCFEEYTTNAQQRLKQGTLKPGEDVRMVNGRVQVSGAVAVMAINGLLAKVIFDKNPGHEFYVEESYPLDWMYPYLSPHGLIFQLHYKPLSELSQKDVEADQKFWGQLTGELIGDWLTNDTPVKAVCDFSDKIFLDKNLDGFKGDMGYEKSQEVQKTFSKLRSSLAGMYAWRADHAQDVSEKVQMRDAADLAFRQAYAICPYSPEAIYRYAEFLVEYKRPDDAFLLVKTSLRLDPNNGQLRDLITWVRASQ
jgi:hypothetical protein